VAELGASIEAGAKAEVTLFSQRPGIQLMAALTAAMQVGGAKLSAML
jgi:hypothetical protein